jgi:putative hydrolase of the HAD superfamily
MNMIHIFDLDDTLYEELLFVKSGFWAVARFGQELFGFDSKDSYAFMLDTLRQKGRGSIFDDWLRAKGCYNKKRVKMCTNVYRHHNPDIALYDSAKKLLNDLAGESMYIVTDGHKIVQANKVKALGISGYFKRVYITHRYGIKNAKPSLYCFNLIKEREKCTWEDITYIGDNPNKDFVNLNRVGAYTIRVRTGYYKELEVCKDYDAEYHIADLSKYLDLIGGLNKQCH